MMQLVACDLDGSLLGQTALQRRIAAGRARLLPMRALGAKLRLWSTQPNYARFRKLWREARPDSGTPVILYGSGDYHHLATSFLETVADPVTVIHFDNHPDWSWCLQRRHCGSWVLEALALPHVERVITIGPCSADVDRPDSDPRRVAALASGGHVVFPWSRVDTRVSRRLPSGAGHSVQGGQLKWHNLSGQNWLDFIVGLRDLIPTRQIWISIDKDVLWPRDAVTNWDQGELTLDHLVTAISRLALAFKVAGVDICGDYSEPRFANPMKSLEAWLDRPEATGDGAQAINDRTNEILLGVLEDVL